MWRTGHEAAATKGDPDVTSRVKQELSYRKQIAHRLRTQYVEGIYDNP